MRKDWLQHFSLQVTPQNRTDERFRSLLNWLFLIVTVGFIVYICFFKILDLDFWWHVKAGEIMVNTHHLITQEPFSYTRAGEAYKPRYEYMAQVVLYLLWHYGGANAVIIWRMVMVSLTFLLLMAIDRRRIWPNVFLVIWVANLDRPSFMDRPQLFSYVFFALWLWLSFTYLEVSTGHGQDKRKKQWLLLGSFVLLQIIWANFHGGTNILAIAIFGALIVQRGWLWWQTRDVQIAQELKILAVTLLCLGLAVMATPNTIGNYTYVFSLANEKSNSMIKEWQPRPFQAYVRELGPFWLLVLASLWFGKRNRLFSLLLLLGMGYLSFQGYRHGTFFFFSALAILFYQLRFQKKYQAWLKELLKHRWLVLGGSLFLTIGFILYIQRWYVSELVINDYFGFGTAPHGAGAYDYLEVNHIKGKMFNTYNVGGYLIYRGYPNRPVFIDGRNVDYGYDFVYETLAARTDPAVWQKLDDKYQFDYAVIDYRGISGPTPYVMHLEKNPKWHLVYFDDWASVYLKDTPQNAGLIAKDGYKLISPNKLQAGSVFEGANVDKEKVKAELLRSAQSSNNSIKARLALAMYQVQNGQPADGRALAEGAQIYYPNRPEPYEIIAISYADEHEWALAALNLELAVSHASVASPPVNYEYMAEVFSKAGDTIRAAQYHRMYLASDLSRQPKATPLVSPTAEPQMP